MRHNGSKPESSTDPLWKAIKNAKIDYFKKKSISSYSFKAIVFKLSWFNFYAIIKNPIVGFFYVEKKLSFFEKYLFFDKEMSQNAFFLILSIEIFQIQKGTFPKSLK